MSFFIGARASCEVLTLQLKHLLASAEDGRLRLGQHPGASKQGRYVVGRRAADPAPRMQSTRLELARNESCIGSHF